jgi:Protein of unknown function (DUF1360)
MAHTDAEKQGLWNSAAFFLFLVLCGTSVAIISAHGSARIEDLNAFDFALLGLATFRLIHLITYDKILDFIRLALMDSEGKPLKTATRGWRRLLCDVMGCIWCAGIWSALLLVTIYLVGSWGHFAVLVLAVAGVGSLLQIISKATAAQY